MHESHPHSVGTPSSLPASHHDNAEIVRAHRISRVPAQASPVTHYRTRSQSSNNFSVEGSPRLVSVSASAGAGGSRILPSPVPPPSSALPPTPSLSATTSPTLSSLPYRGSRSSNGSAYAASSILSRSSVRKNLKPLNVGLTHEEHAVLVAKILSDLRPASHIATTTTARPASRAFSPATTIASAHQRLAANKMTIGKIGSNSTSTGSGNDGTDAAADAFSQSDESHLDGNAKLSTSTSKSSTPQLSQSRTPTPTTPASPSAASSHLDADETASSEVEPTSPADGAEKNLLTPTAALESLRTLENSFTRSSVHLPREESSATLTESKPSSPTTSKTNMDDKEATPAAGASPRNKRCSSYRKSVPTLAELGDGKNNALGITAKLASSPSSDNRRLSSSTAKTDTDPSWIPSLTTLEAIRVLAFQQDVAEALASPNTAAAAAKNGGAAAAETESAAATSADEVLALRYALKFAIARADRLAEALSRANEDKMKTETELEILRRNVLSMLGSRSMFGEAPQQNTRARQAVDDDVLEEPETDHFDDARSRQSDLPPLEQSTPRSKLPATVEPSPRTSSAAAASAAASTVARPARAARTVKPTIKQTTPNGSVSIASLRKNNLSTSAISQRYTPARTAFDANSTTTASDDEDDDDDEFSMYPFGAASARRTLPEVSMADFLNASRMSKIEIEQHDARRELERTLEESTDRYSTNSRSPLAGLGGSVGRKGLLKSLGRIVDGQRRKDGRDAREGGERKNYLVTYQESIIPSYLPV